MKLKTISAQHSTSEMIAFLTDPPLTPEVFHHFKSRLGNARELAGLTFGESGGALMVSWQNFTPNLMAPIEAILTMAEETLAAEKEAEHKNIQTQGDVQRAGTEATAKAFGLPAQKPSEKRIFPALVLCFFLGFLGAHAFYAGRRKQGVAMLACLLAPVLVFALPMFIPKMEETLYYGDSKVPLWIYFAFIFLPPLFLGLHVLCDLVRLLLGSYKDGRGLKIMKWT
jgi:hypothetical protein